MSNYVTLDGFFAGPKGEIDWFVWNEEMVAYSRGVLASIDTMIFGRVTYELMAGYWPTASPPAEDQVIIDAMNNTRKVVFSRTLEKVGWRNSILVTGDMAQEVSKLKQQSGRDMVIYGSGSVVSALARAGLIDEYQFLVNPVVLGAGKPLFSGLRDLVKLELLEARTFQCGVALLRYQPAARGLE